ncbi:BTAD domain-containing putative transcriptional regulator [Streptomyces sp. GD-15H]|uniref:BTAD domain-containing putative transcriptional regulator n=1 Tax=Streptomyces sp. GD-15H TaxID=3129112 RepID=UPI00324BCE36
MGESPPPSSTTTLQTYIYQLRKTLGIGGAGNLAQLSGNPAAADREPVLHTMMNGYLLGLPGKALDSQEFVSRARRGRAEMAAGELEKASVTFRSALGLWRGSAMTGVAVGPILQAEDVRLEELRKTVLEQRIDIDLRLGRHREVIGELIGIVAQQPIHEGFQAKLMLALYQAGRRSEALLAYQSARSALTRELGLEPSAELRKLHQKMIAGEPVMENATHPAARTTPVIRLPPGLPRLVGRDSELEQVGAAVDDRLASAPAVLVLGPPGSGKSAFLTYAAHRIRSAYPDGDLYARLLGPDGAPVPPETVLNDFLRAIGVRPDRIPATLEERSRMFRSWADGRKVLIVLDDATDPAQLRPLLTAGPDSAVLVAARRRLVDPALTATVELAPLSPGAARRLLADACGDHRLADDAAATQGLLDLCARLPVALRVVADQGRLRPHWPMARLLRSYRSTGAGARPGPDAGQGLDDIALGELGLLESVDRTRRLLGATERRAVHRLAAEAGPAVTPDEVAGLLGVEPQDAEALLEHLVEHYLLRPDPDPDADRAPSGGAAAEAGGRFRYRFVPTVRAALAALTDPVPAERRDGERVSVPGRAVPVSGTAGPVLVTR